VETPDERLPYKVAVTKDGRTLAEQSVTSKLAADELIEVLLPVLRKLTMRNRPTTPLAESGSNSPPDELSTIDVGHTRLVGPTGASFLLDATLAAHLA
jgi:hypothetical protein